MVLLNKSDLSDPQANKRWIEYFENKGMDVENQRPLEIFKEDVEELAEKLGALAPVKGDSKKVMFAKKFNTQREACEYYGHTWKYIEKHYKVQRCYTSQGFQGYFISKR